MISIEKHPVRGAWLLSTIHKGYLVRRIYFGYSKTEARLIFKAYLSAL